MGLGQFESLNCWGINWSSLTAPAIFSPSIKVLEAIAWAGAGHVSAFARSLGPGRDDGVDSRAHDRPAVRPGRRAIELAIDGAAVARCRPFGKHAPDRGPVGTVRSHGKARSRTDAQVGARRELAARRIVHRSSDSLAPVHRPDRRRGRDPRIAVESRRCGRGRQGTSAPPMRI